MNFNTRLKKHYDSHLGRIWQNGHGAPEIHNAENF